MNFFKKNLVAKFIPFRPVHRTNLSLKKHFRSDDPNVELVYNGSPIQECGSSYHSQTMMRSFDTDGARAGFVAVTSHPKDKLGRDKECNLVLDPVFFVALFNNFMLSEIIKSVGRDVVEGHNAYMSIEGALESGIPSPTKTVNLSPRIDRFYDQDNCFSFQLVLSVSTFSHIMKQKMLKNVTLWKSGRELMVGPEDLQVSIRVHTWQAQYGKEDKPRSLEELREMPLSHTHNGFYANMATVLSLLESPELEDHIVNTIIKVKRAVGQEQRDFLFSGPWTRFTEDELEVAAHDPAGFRRICGKKKAEEMTKFDKMGGLRKLEEDENCNMFEIFESV